MNLKTWIPLCAAIVLGLVAAKLGYDMMGQSGGQRDENAPPLSSIVVASGHIQPGHELTSEDLTVTQIAADVAGAGFANPQQLVGRVVMGDVEKGQPLFENMLAPQGGGSGLQALVPVGMRAITVEVNEFSGVAGMLVPGCLVDVMTTFHEDDETIARTIVEGVRVTAVGRRTSKSDASEALEAAKPDDTFRSVTLLTYPKDAEAIELAATTGRPRLVLRSNKDDEPTMSEGVTLAELIGHPSRGEAGKDPFVPVIDVPQRPATQPTAAPTPTVSFEPSAPPRERVAPKRSITIIRGGVPSEVLMETRPFTATGGRFMTGIDTKPVTN